MKVLELVELIQSVSQEARALTVKQVDKLKKKDLEKDI